MRTLTFSLAGAALALSLAMSSAQAAPSGLTLLKEAAPAGSLVEKTHGWHHSCVRWRGWWHRHRSNGRAVSCWHHRHRHCYINRRGARVCVWR